MRTVLRLLGTRYGIALVLIVIVLGVVGATKTFVGGSSSSTLPVGPPISPASASPEPDSSFGNDSVVAPSTDQTGPSLSPNSPSANTVASQFIAAWLKHANVTGDQWREGLKPFATDGLMAKLAETDPEDVPASEVSGQTQTVNDGSVAQSSIPVNGGTVNLQLVVLNGRWRVDGIDWDPS
jgi:hypothetical protein